MAQTSARSSCMILRLCGQEILCTLGLSFTSPTILSSMSELTLLPSMTVECAWCKDPKPITETTWFMREPGERSVRLCNFCYQEARKQLRRLRFFFQAEDGIRDLTVTGVQTCALPI